MQCVFPTHVGMNRMIDTIAFEVPSVPHARGDEPNRTRLADEAWECSPRTWG